MDWTEKKLDGQTIFDGRVLRLEVDRVLLPNGHESTREVVRHPGGVAIVAVDDEGCVLTVRQYRYVFGTVIEEIPAGKLEPNELPRLSAARELREETGATAENWTFLGSFYASPGCYSEILHLYLAQSLRFSEQCLDEDEFLTVHRTPFATLYRQALAGKLPDAKTTTGLLLAAQHLSPYIEEVSKGAV